MAQRDRVLQFRSFLAERLEIDRDTERCARLVLPGIATADVARLVVKAIHLTLERIVHLARFGHELRLVLEQREDADFHWRDPRMETEDSALFDFAVHVRL